MTDKVTIRPTPIQWNATHDAMELTQLYVDKFLSEYEPLRRYICKILCISEYSGTKTSRLFC